MEEQVFGDDGGGRIYNDQTRELDRISLGASGAEPFYPSYIVDGNFTVINDRGEEVSLGGDFAIASKAIRGFAEPLDICNTSEIQGAAQYLVDGLLQCEALPISHILDRAKTMFDMPGKTWICHYIVARWEALQLVSTQRIGGVTLDAIPGHEGFSDYYVRTMVQPATLLRSLPVAPFDCSCGPEELPKGCVHEDDAAEAC